MVKNETTIDKVINSDLTDTNIVKNNIPSSYESRLINWTTIGKGAQGTVYKVWDTELQLNVAVKIIASVSTKNQKAIDRLRNEVKISRRLRHMGIAAIYDIVNLSDDRIALVMELIEGCVLKDWIKTCKDDRWRYSDDFLIILKRLLEALIVAHRDHVVHRDIKPDNIMLRNSDINMPILLDFGIALNSQLTPDGLRCGTPLYMSPEQWIHPEKTSCQSDIYSLGVMAYEFFAGRLPSCSLGKSANKMFISHYSIDEILSICSYNARVTAPIDQLIRSMMSYEPEKRPASTQEIFNKLSNLSLTSKEKSVSNTNNQTNLLKKMLFVKVPEGYFYIGTAGKEGNKTEHPRLRIYISTFSISINPITNREYKQFLEATGHQFPPFIKDALFGAEDHPIVGITWDEAQKFCQWFGGDLPTEAQWEKAAKGTDGRIYPWGNHFDTIHANIDMCQTTTTKTGSFTSGVSPYGCLDMAGNIREWCKDWYDPKYYQRINSGEINPMCQNIGKEKVLRGGGFRSFKDEARCTFRGHGALNLREPDIGFRIVVNENINN